MKDDPATAVQANGRDAAIFTLSGSLAKETAADLVESIREAAHGPGVILLAHDVNEVDSAGLGSLIRGLKATQDAGCRLALAEPSDELRRMLDLTGLDQVLPVFDDVNAARSYLIKASA